MDIISDSDSEGAGSIPAGVTKSTSGCIPLLDIRSFPSSIFFVAKKRTKGDKKIVGVCSGLANYIELDSTSRPILFIAVFFWVWQGYCLILLWGW